MEKVSTKRTKCPECGNYMTVSLHNNGSESGKCPVCKSVIYKKQPRPKEKIIKIVTL